MIYCDECGEPHSHPLPMCRGLTCRARVCRRCRDTEGVCRSCVREAAKIGDSAEFIAILLSGAVIGGHRLPVVSSEDPDHA